MLTKDASSKRLAISGHDFDNPVFEENQVIKKMEHPESKAKVLYKLTQKGIDLLPLLIEINLWADKYLTIPEDKAEMIRHIKKDKAAFIKRVSENLQVAGK